MPIETLDFNTSPPTEGTLAIAADSDVSGGSVVLYPVGAVDPVEMSVAQLKESTNRRWAPTFSSLVLNEDDTITDVGSLALFTASYVGGGPIRHFEIHVQHTPGTIVVQRVVFSVTFPFPVSDFYGNCSTYLNAYGVLPVNDYAGETGGGGIGVVDGDVGPTYSRFKSVINYQTFAWTADRKISVIRGVMIL